MISIGQVGIGEWGQNHFEILDDIEGTGNIYIVGIYDSDTEKLKQLLGIKGYPHYNLSRLINDIDALIITTPHIYSLRNSQASP